MYSITLLTTNGEHLTVASVRGKYHVHEEVKHLDGMYIPLYASETDNETKEKYYVPQYALFREYQISWDYLVDFINVLGSFKALNEKIGISIRIYSAYHGRLTASEQAILSELSFEVFPYTHETFIAVPSRYIREKGYYNE